jgi:hypothetical protein
LLGAVQDSQDSHVIVHFVDSDERESIEDKLTSAFDASRASAIGKRMERRNAFDNGLGYAVRGTRIRLGDVVADAFEIVSSVRRPTDAHQPR